MKLVSLDSANFVTNISLPAPGYNPKPQELLRPDDESVSIGWRWDGAAFTNPDTLLHWGVPDLDPRYFWIDSGPWRDRFGVDWLAITSSSHEMCKAATQLWLDRKYINIKDPRNAQVLDALIATAQPAANPLFPGSGPMSVGKKAVILAAVTTEYERHVKGLRQPQ